MNIFLVINYNQLTVKSIQSDAAKTGSIQQLGFTLIEMLITMVILSVLLGLAVTGLQPIIERSQSENTLSSLRTDLVFSRGEAIKRGGWVGFCGTDTGSACSTDFQHGWLVFHDLDRDSLYNNADTVLASTKQEYSTLKVDLEELEASEYGPVIFNYRGYPDRSVRFRSYKGDAKDSFILQTTGSISRQ